MLQGELENQRTGFQMLAENRAISGSYDDRLGESISKMIQMSKSLSAMLTKQGLNVDQEATDKDDNTELVGELRTLTISITRIFRASNEIYEMIFDMQELMRESRMQSL